MKSRAPAGFALLAFFSLLSGTAAGQDAKPGDPAPPPASEPSTPPAPAQPAAPQPAAPADTQAVPPEPPPFAASSDVAPNPVSEATTPAASGRRLVFTAGLGYTSGGSIKHPELSGNGFSGEMLELAGGVELNPKWHLTLSFTSFQTKLERAGNSPQFRSGAFHGGGGYQPLVGCPDCTTGGGLGGLVARQPMHVHTLGPRLDYLPFGSDSLYVGVTAGAAMMQDLSFRGGFAVAARAGFEWRPYSALGVALEAGAHGQVYSDSSAALPYAALQLRLLAPMPPTNRFTTVTNEGGSGPAPAPTSPLLPPRPPPYK